MGSFPWPGRCQRATPRLFPGLPSAHSTAFCWPLSLRCRVWWQLSSCLNYHSHFWLGAQYHNPFLFFFQTSQSAIKLETHFSRQQHLCSWGCQLLQPIANTVLKISCATEACTVGADLCIQHRDFDLQNSGEVTSVLPTDACLFCSAVQGRDRQVSIGICTELSRQLRTSFGTWNIKKKIKKKKKKKKRVTSTGKNEL